jgi:ESCRT-II complex subunit VPS22
MNELVRILTKLRGLGAGAITEEDVVRSIKTLKPLGAGYEVIEMGEGRKMVRSVVKQLDQDQTVALAVAQAHGGRVDEHMLVQEKGWTEGRAATALQNMLLRDGLCWLDEQGEGGTVLYWVPSAMQWDP